MEYDYDLVSGSQSSTIVRKGYPPAIHNEKSQNLMVLFIVFIIIEDHIIIH